MSSTEAAAAAAAADAAPATAPATATATQPQEKTPPAPVSRSSSRASGHTAVAGSTTPASITKDAEKGEQSPETISQVSAKDDPDSVRSVHGLRWALVCASIYLAAFTYGLDTTIAADVQSAVVETFDEVDQLSWLGTGFFLGTIATILPYGNLFERFDIKWDFLSGILLFEIGSAICGAAPSMNALIVGRVIAGVGGAGVYLGGLTYFSALTSEKERGSYIAGIGVCWGVGAVLGPIIGGAFSQSSATWRWAFYINLVIAALCAPIYLTMPGYEPMPNASRATKLRSLDWLGSLLNAASWATFTILFTFAGNQWAWNSAQTIALFVLFGVFLLSLILQQAFAIGTTKQSRLFPAHLLLSRSQVLLATATAASTSAMFVPIYYIPIYMQFVHGDNAIEAAVRLLPFLVISMGTNLAIGTVVTKIPLYAPLYLVSGLLVIAGSAPLYVWTASTPISQIYGLSVIVALGAGIVVQIGYTLASVKAARQNRSEDIPHTIALQNVAQIGGGAIALIVSGQVFQSTVAQALGQVLGDYHFTQQQLQSVVAGTQSAVFQQLAAADQIRATEAITGAMANVWLLVIAGAGLVIAASLAMRWERLF